jgi:hypothetical protein
MLQGMGRNKWSHYIRYGPTRDGTLLKILHPISAHGTSYSSDYFAKSEIYQIRRI